MVFITFIIFLLLYEYNKQIKIKRIKNMDEFLNKFFEETKEELTELLQNKNLNQLFKLIEKINTAENTEKDLDSLNYSQILYNIMFNFSNKNFKNIVTRCGCHYLADMINFLHHIDTCIENCVPLYFLKIRIKWMKNLEVYTFSWENDNMVVGNYIDPDSNYIITKLCKICINYDKLFEILKEILKDENWEKKSKFLKNEEYYVFNNEKAFNKYFK